MVFRCSQDFVFLPLALSPLAWLSAFLFMALFETYEKNMLEVQLFQLIQSAVKHRGVELKSCSIE
jgi:hypothetical protein